MFVSCVRPSGRGEAEWACERGVFVNAGGLHSNISSGLGWAFSFLLFVFVAIYMGFKFFSKNPLLFMLVFWFLSALFAF